MNREVFEAKKQCEALKAELAEAFRLRTFRLDERDNLLRQLIDAKQEHRICHASLVEANERFALAEKERDSLKSELTMTKAHLVDANAFLIHHTRCIEEQGRAHSEAMDQLLDENDSLKAQLATAKETIDKAEKARDDLDAKLRLFGERKP